MLNSGKKNLRFARQKKNNLTLVLSEKKFLNETKNHNPPFKLNGRSLIICKTARFYYLLLHICILLISHDLNSIDHGT